MAVRQPELPPPTSGLLVEVNFRRFLQCCERIVAGDCLGRTDLCDWQRSPTFHQVRSTLRSYALWPKGAVGSCCTLESPSNKFWSALQYVDTLQELLADLQGSSSRR